MTNQNDLIDRLGKLGMSGYEAKAYLALVTASRPLNGYEVAKLSGVPRSTVYETLGKLVARGAAFEARGSNDAVAYLPLPPNSLLARMHAEFSESLDALRRALPRLAAPQEAHLIHNILDRGALLERAADVIRESRWDLYVSVWPEEYDDLAPALADAEARGVEVMMLVFGEDTPEVGRTYRHRYSSPEFVMQYLGYRLFGVVGDSQQSVIGGFSEDTGWGVFSDNPAVVLLATEYIRHDIAIQILGTNLGPDRVRELMRSNPEFIKLRASRSGDTHAKPVLSATAEPKPPARPRATKAAASPSKTRRAGQPGARG
jgi:sugar-specific transcriptional regulator TrmB